MKTPSLLGVGLYTFADAAPLLNVPRRTLRGWAEGYASGSAPLLPDGPHTDTGDRLLTFADLIELKFVALFRREGVTLPTIRRRRRRTPCGSSARRTPSPSNASTQTASAFRYLAGRGERKPAAGIGAGSNGD